MTDTGFVWQIEGAADVLVERTAELPQSRGIISIRTERCSLELYVTRTGLVRVFKNHRELK